MISGAFNYSQSSSKGDIEHNPGPPKRGRPAKHPCKRCGYAVNNKNKGVQCKKCELFTHNNCINDLDFVPKLTDFCSTNWCCTTAETYEPDFNFTESFFDSPPRNPVENEGIQSTPGRDTPAALIPILDPLTTFNDEASLHLPRDYLETEEDSLDDALNFNESYFSVDTPNVSIDKASLTNSSDISTSTIDTNDEIQEDCVVSKLKELRQKHGAKSTIAYLNINSYRYKYCDVVSILNRNI
jgi:hypothetical protein